nr:glucose-methanol-choline oxidoreductase, FAD/NAD(P)-binding domain protein [Tanacetum cinerariifolium]
MGNYRRKEDDVYKISTSVFITNFPESCSAKELFQACKQYGHVVDTFIPNKRSKIGRRFGFVHFINVFNEERLVNNLCTVWIDRFKLHANIARFHRTLLNEKKSMPKKAGGVISTSVFITNFPESFSAKELFQSCKQYDHVVDTFISNKRSKTRRRFGFVHFINVFNEERLVNNLCTVWIDRFKLHANIARFHRTPLNEKKSMPKKAGGVKKDTGVNEVGNPYVHVVKGQMQPENKESKATPALVLSDECLLLKDLSKSLFGRVKQFAPLANIRKAVTSMEFNTKGRIAWVEVEGIPFKLCLDNRFKCIATKWGELLDIDDQDEMCFHSKRLCIYTKSEMNIFEEFKIIFRDRDFWIRAKEAPGWVPDFMEENDD